MEKNYFTTLDFLEVGLQLAMVVGEILTWVVMKQRDNW